MFFERLISRRYLRPRKKQGFVSLISLFSLVGIALGVATLIIVMAVMNGTKTEIVKSVLGFDSHLTISSPFGIDNYDEISKDINQIEDVDYNLPVVEGTVLATANNNYNVVMVTGLEADDISNTKIKDSLQTGSIWQKSSDVSGLDKILIGNLMANKFGIGVGDYVQLISPQSSDTFFGNVPTTKDFEVVGVFSLGVNHIDENAVFIPLEMAQAYFSLDGKVNSLKIYLDNKDEIESVSDAINSKYDGANIISWKDKYGSWLNTIDVQSNVFFIILSLIVIVAAFNIVSSMVMMVNNKNVEIAILRTMGASSRSILKIFIMSGAMIGVIGTIIGFVGGYFIAINLDDIRLWLEQLSGRQLFSAEAYFLSQLPAEINNGDVIKVVLTSLAISFIAPIYPAWKASRINPAESLRYG